MLFGVKTLHARIYDSGRSYFNKENTEDTPYGF